jgi:hypothetical protein
MPTTQAYSVDWDVEIGGTNVDRDVVEAVIRETQEDPDTATVQLDTSERPHAVEEQTPLTIELDDGNDKTTFSGEVDSVKDSKTEPLVTIDAREPAGALDDISAVATIDESDIFDVIDTLIDDSPGAVDRITFDPSSLKSSYGTFGGSVVFGNLSIAHYSNFGVNSDEFTQQETVSGQGKSAELQIGNYRNNTGTTYQATLEGKDGNGDDVELVFDLPPGEDPVDAYGTDTFKLPVSGGTGLVAEIDSITTDVPSLPPGAGTRQVSMDADVKNYVKTDYRFQIGDDNSVRDALDLLVGYISTLDNSRTWEYYVTNPVSGKAELKLRPEGSGPGATTYVFTEGNNVRRPVANRSLDGVYNMVKVEGNGDVNAWFWAWDGTFYYSFNNPFESGEYPDDPDFMTTFGSTGGINDIDQIGLRAVSLRDDNIGDVFQANDVGQDALKQLLRSPVSGVATTSGIHPSDPGDKAEVYYPSRGIPAKVADNVYTIKSVEYRVTSSESETKIDFGITEPATGDLLGGGGVTSVRDDLSEGLQNELSSESTAFPVKGTIQAANSDGTFRVSADNGETYDNVTIL